MIECGAYRAYDLQAAPVQRSYGEKMSTAFILSIAIAVFLVVDGIYAIIRGKTIGEKYNPKYTGESSAAYNRFSGAFLILAAIGIALIRFQEYVFQDKQFLTTIGWIVLGIAVAAVIGGHFIFVKKAEDKDK